MTSIVLDEPAVVVRPGDTLIVRISTASPPLTDERADAARKKLQAALPDGVEIVLMQADQMLVARP